MHIFRRWRAFWRFLHRSGLDRVLGSLLIIGLSCSVYAADSTFDHVRLKPLTMTGWNADVVMENDNSPFARNFDRRDQNDFGLGAASWFESGLQGYSDGFPVSRQFASALNTNILFELQPYETNNVLRLDLRAGKTSGTLRLNDPGSFAALSIAAASGSGGGTGVFFLNFTDGTSRGPLSFNAPDWLANEPGLAIKDAARPAGPTSLTESRSVSGWAFIRPTLTWWPSGLTGG